MSYHVVTHGTCWACLLDGDPVELRAGDVVVFPHGDAHAMCSAPGMRDAPDMGRFRPPSNGQLPFTLSVGEAQDDPVHLVCGFLGCDAGPFNPLLSALPRVIRVGDQQGGAIGAFVQFVLAESNQHRIGGESSLDG